MVTPAARREAVAHLVEAHEMSERRAWRVAGVDRSSVRYRSTRPSDGDLRRRLRELAAERRRFGYRRLHVLLRREGVEVNRKRVQRLYREEKRMRPVCPALRERAACPSFPPDRVTMSISG